MRALEAGPGAPPWRPAAPAGDPSPHAEGQLVLELGSAGASERLGGA